MRYVNRTDLCTHAQTKLSIERTSVGLAHTCPIMREERPVAVAMAISIAIKKTTNETLTTCLK